jgi:hypothetical protein
MTEEKYNDLRHLAGEILAAVHLNFLRGTIKVDGPIDEFQNLLDQWESRMSEHNGKPL